MEKPTPVQTFLNKNITWVIFLIFAGGIFYANTEAGQNALSTLIRRVDKKTEILNAIDSRVRAIELDRAYEKGYNAGFRQCEEDYNLIGK